MVNRIKALVLTRPIGAQAPARQRITDDLPTRVDDGGGFAPWLVVIPVISLTIAGLLIMVLSTFVEAPPLSQSQSSFDAEEEVQVDLPVIDAFDVGETTVHLRPAFSR